MPAARVVHAFTGIAFLEFGQVEAGAEVIAFALDHGGPGVGGQVLEHVAQGFHQRIVQRVALGGTAQTHDGHGTPHFQAHPVGCCAFKDGVAHGVSFVLVADGLQYSYF
jgi:hypothetical protein